MNKTAIKHLQKNAGFTIVELLIVIVVIAILAAISIVAYTGIQNRAHDSALQSDANVIRKVIKMYYADNGSYPICSAGSGHSCTLASLASELVPTYVSGLPDDPAHPYMYVATNIPANGDRWSVRIYKESIDATCQIGENYYVGWWSSSPAC